MLKITKRIDGRRPVIRLEGELREPWVSAVRLACTTRGSRSPRPHLDVSSVTFVDRAGADLLRTLRRGGIAIIAASGYVREVLDDSDPVAPH